MKHKISISIDESTLYKIDLGVLRRKFRNRSHAFEYAISEILNEEDKNDKPIKK